MATAQSMNNNGFTPPSVLAQSSDKAAVSDSGKGSKFAIQALLFDCCIWNVAMTATELPPISFRGIVH